MEHVPLGQVQIGVNTDAAKGIAVRAMMSAKASGTRPPSLVDVPKKYFQPSTSGIKTRIKHGSNQFDIKL
ncbi:MAG: hypothetical protein RMJ16_03285 [Thermoguttaceae bacterium]|nr:hypothetical protein [Thermoguttaceae bacterium]